MSNNQVNHALYHPQPNLNHVRENYTTKQRESKARTTMHYIHE